MVFGYRQAISFQFDFDKEVAKQERVDKEIREETEAAKKR